MTESPWLPPWLMLVKVGLTEHLRLLKYLFLLESDCWLVKGRKLILQQHWSSTEILNGVLILPASQTKMFFLFSISEISYIFQPSYLRWTFLYTQLAKILQRMHVSFKISSVVIFLKTEIIWNWEPDYRRQPPLLRSMLPLLVHR